MKKFILSGFLIISLLGVAHADQQIAQVAGSSITVHTVSVSSGVASAVDYAAVRMDQREAIEIQNVDSSSVLWCGFNQANVTVGTGRMIGVDGGFWNLALAANSPDGPMTLYCITDSGAGTTNVTITQTY